jgi:hypothetical protein
MSANRETPLRVLFAGATRLAYPACDDEEVRLAVLRYERYLADPPHGEDKFGNPLWIHPAPSSSGAAAEGRGKAGEALYRKTVAAEDDAASDPDPRDTNWLQSFFSRRGRTEPAGNNKNGARHSFGDTGRSGVPVRLIRAAMFVALFAVLYYFFVEFF